MPSTVAQAIQQDLLALPDRSEGGVDVGSQAGLPPNNLAIDSLWTNNLVSTSWRSDFPALAPRTMSKSTPADLTEPCSVYRLSCF